MVVCQVCHMAGHSASECWHRYDHNYQSVSSQYPQQQQQFSTSNSNTNMATLSAYSDYSYENGWFPDSGATNHVTAEPRNMYHGSEYSGSDQLYVENGTGLSIQRIGNTFVKSPINSSISFSLNNMLLVPSITKNLVSVSKFTKDNHVFFEFHSDYCCVKSQGSKEVLLEGTVREDGFYCFKDFHPQHVSSSKSFSSHTPVSHNTTALVSEKSCSSAYLMWHFRLGHPHQSVVNTVLQKCNIQNVNKNHLDF